jgi:multisubunit Na+/H+ antiporter MnhB subunit
MEARAKWIDGRLDDRFDHIDRRFDSVERRFDRVEKRLDWLIALFVGVLVALLVAFVKGGLGG